MSALSDLRTVAVHDGFRKLFAVRLVSQCGDGMFQVGLATLYFFNPQNMATATGVAAAFAVLLLPFTVVGPFVGPLLDRWRRRQVLLLGNAARVVLSLGLAVLVATAGAGIGVVSVLALVTLGVNRFLLAALSAGLPRVVPRDQLLMANTLTPTLGGVASVVGAVLGLLIGVLAPGATDAVALICAALLFAAASLLALRLGRDRLGPPPQVRAAGLLHNVRGTLTDLAEGAAYLVRRGTPALGLGAMSLHRFLYGVNFIALILISRNLLVDPSDAAAGLGMFAVLAGVSFAGNGLAIILTPVAHQRMSPSRWILVCLGIGAVSQLLLVTVPVVGVVGASAVLLGLSVQGAKIAVDTIVHRDTHDDYRGRAFSIYDVLYNAAFVAAAGLGAVALPDTGWSRAVFAGLALAYLVLALGYRTAVGRLRDEPRAVRPGPPGSRFAP